MGHGDKIMSKRSIEKRMWDQNIWKLVVASTRPAAVEG